MSSAKILVIEDEKIVATDIKNSLKRLGYVGSSTVNSREEIIKKIEEESPELVIINILLNGNINSVSVAETIRSRLHIPVIYLAAYSDERKVQQATVTEPFSYVFIPFEERDLQFAIEIALYKNQMEKQLKKQEQQFDKIIKSIGDAVVVTDNSGCIQFMNPVAEALTGWNQEEAFGKDLVEVLCLIDKNTGEATENPAATVMREGVVLSLPNGGMLVAKDGTERLIGDSAAPIRDRKGNITGVILTFQDISERKQAEERLLRSAFHEGLTELPNRVLFLDRLEQAVERARRREDYHFAVLFLDLDGFKAINDRFGHSIGDKLLVAIARRLEMCLRAGDSVARLGADEFGILLEEIHELGDATYVAERIQAALAFPLKFGGQEICISVSIGIVLSNTGYNRPETLLQDADRAMYQAKVQGKARYAVFDRAMRQNKTPSKDEFDLTEAINNNCLQLLYQPIVSLYTGRIAGFEALVRWQHPLHGLITPAEFMAVAEASGLICSLGAWVLGEACRQINIFLRQFPTNPPLFISVNLSGTELAQTNLVEQIEQILEQTQLDACSLQLEITESALIPDSTASSTLQQLRSRGIRLCVSKFSAGYSFLSYLYRFPVSILKIDRAFISRIDDLENWEMVQAIVMLAHNLGLNVTATGVEKAEQLAQLRQLRCKYGQGYFFSQALDSEAAAALLANAPQW